MRKLIVSNLVSLDGAFAGPGGDVMACRWTTSSTSTTPSGSGPRTRCWSAARRTRASGFGRPWSTTPRRPRRAARRKINSKIQKVVVSDTLTPGHRGVGYTTRIVRRAEAHAAITDLKAGPGRDIVVFGSGTMWNDLFAAGLVDELYVMVGPSIVPDGRRRSPSRHPRTWVVGTRTLAGSDNVLIHYATTPA